MLHKNVKICYTDDYQIKYDLVIGTLYKLNYLEPYKQGNEMSALNGASLGDLVFLLF